MYCTPGPLNSNLISTENAVPNSPENNAKIKYNVPISLAFEDKNQRSHHIDISDLFSMDFSSLYMFWVCELLERKSIS
jgi:hypothetical protein